MTDHPFSIVALCLVLLVAATAPGQEYQVNTPAASLDFGGVQGTGTVPSVHMAAQGATEQLNFSSSLVGLGYDILVTSMPLVPASQSGLVTGAGQIINVDITDPALAFISTGSAIAGFPSLPSPGSFSITFTVPSAISLTDFSLQMAVLDPTHADGIVLSQGSQLECRVDWGGHPYNSSNLTCPPYATPLSLGNDDAVMLQLQAPFTFYGTASTQVFVHSNGFITFDFVGPLATLPDASIFNTISPLIAACVTDFDPSLGGTISAGVAGPTFDVCFTNVPLSNGTGANTFRLQVNPGGMFIYFDPAMNVTDALVGFSAGWTTNPTVSLNWSWMGGPNGPLSFLQNGLPYSPYQQFTAAAPFDLAGNSLIWLFGANGVPSNLP